MRTNVQFEDIKFYVNPAKKTVTCKAEVNIDNVFKDCWNYETFTKIKKFLIKEYHIEWLPVGGFVAIAVAKCHPADTFDSELGCKIAESKMKRAVFKIVDRCILYAIDEEEKVIANLRDLSTGCYYASKTEQKHIVELWGKFGNNEDNNK